MGDRRDIAEIDPVLELTFGPCTLECAGTLNSMTRRHVLEAVEVMLDGKPASVRIDVARLRVTDTDGANALLAAQRKIRGAGVRLRWQGLEDARLRAVLRQEAVDTVRISPDPSQPTEDGLGVRLERTPRIGTLQPERHG